MTPTSATAQIDGALAAVEQALATVGTIAAALTEAQQALVSAKADLHDAILTQVQDEVMEALIAMRAKKQQKNG